ncbi:replication initiation factor domain-containing protein [Vibrio parahaemolyticus]|uniref:replication initiation factor domain-containing protein n=1 Tax=Vibrio parahaemolyticus TaxID=670 RepID=UPI0028782B72|nr:replication initiation factor domain-containing protein [Vibrio parahaemolyticus]EJL7851233.1 replication initiation factor domain-containing protein [Vibrio parahaemolyticus]MDS1925866.1 replication initiation factor domain-containing protein [Vibrio parahaemolyticus]
MQFKDETRPVKIDHLAFTFNYGDLRHLDKSNDQDFINLQIPEFRQPTSSTPDAIESAMERHKDKVRKVLSHRFDEFMSKIFGFRLSPMRGRGLHGYQDSMVILDKTGTVECGLVGIGGNNDTVFVQINGTGCTKLFDYTTHKKIHFWLATVLGVTRLARLDLAVDDYTGVFDCGYAEICFYNGAFRTAKRGRGPSMVPHKRITESGELMEEATIVGSRSSTVYWRIYNKKLEQKITDPEVIWYRNEVELKKCDVDMLASPASAFAGLCDFAASIEPSEPVKFSKNKKAQGLEFFSRIAWARRQCGKALSEVIAMTEGDLGEAFGMLIPEKYRRTNFNELGVPDAYAHLKSLTLESQGYANNYSSSY